MHILRLVKTKLNPQTDEIFIKTDCASHWKTYHHYFSYNADDALDSYPVEGVFSPQPVDGRQSPEPPRNGLQRLSRASSCRPASRAPTPGRPASRMHVGVQVGHGAPLSWSLCILNSLF